MIDLIKVAFPQNLPYLISNIFLGFSDSSSSCQTLLATEMH